MFVTKCDVCRKEVSRGKYVTVGYRGSFAQFSFCETCGKPVILFLQKKLLLEVANTSVQKKSLGQKMGKRGEKNDGKSQS